MSEYSLRGTLSWLQFLAATECHDQGQLPEVVYWVLKVSEAPGGGGTRL